jgi:hypothetical protein
MPPHLLSPYLGGGVPGYRPPIGTSLQGPQWHRPVPEAAT